MKDKTSAGLLALFLGGLGGHKFYLGRPGIGLIYLLFCWTFIPAFVAFIEAIMLFAMSHEEFNAKYNAGMALAVAAPQNIVVNVANTATSHANDRVAQLRELYSLMTSGAISADEYETEKRRVLVSGT
jgi:TM2 domain-containing membrane protein YozV